jgi:DNA-3-methyladenine glycosylase II
MIAYFQYGEKEIVHLKKADRKLAEVINRTGMIQRRVTPDLFTALVHAIVEQQRPTNAHQTVWKRMSKKLGEISPEMIDGLSMETIQQFGITFRKAAHIKSAARKIVTGKLDINALYSMTDEDVCAKLTELGGIGVWTAEMLMMFSMQRPNVLIYDDWAIRRGLQMLHHRREIDMETFNRYRKRYTPYASVASLYLWAIAGKTTDWLADCSFKEKNSEQP